MSQHQHGSQSRRKSTVEGPAIQVICLGAGGGPSEDNVTGFLVRSTATQWAKGSILAVDAGAHLSAIIAVLKDYFPMFSDARPTSSNSRQTGDSSNSRSASPEEVLTTLDVGPFAGLPFPHASARANALHVLREYVSTYLITHPHLDHFAAFAINTAGLIHGRKAKHLAGLEFTVKAIKDHIFNDIIWPNMTNEEKGIGFVNLLSLTAGGNVALGEGESRGFIEVCEGLAVKGFKISHGSCGAATISEADTRRGSAVGMQDGSWHIPNTPGKQIVDGLTGRRGSLYSGASQPATPTIPPQSPALTTPDGRTVVDSTAFFIRAEPSGREILMFGDVEPDSISHGPRNYLVWQEAAPKFIQGSLAAVFIECSYADSQADSMLFGHLVPRHLIQELANLADIVVERRRESIGNGNAVSDRKRKRQSMGVSGPHSATPPIDSASTSLAMSPMSGKQRRTTSRPSHLHDVSEDATVPMHVATPTVPDTPVGNLTLDSPAPVLPLAGLTVVVIHVKDDMRDGPWVGDTIASELKAHEARLVSQGRGLGCDFRVSRGGESYFF